MSTQRISSLRRDAGVWPIRANPRFCPIWPPLRVRIAKGRIVQSLSPENYCEVTPVCRADTFVGVFINESFKQMYLQKCRE